MSTPQAETVKLDPVSLLLNASGPVRLTVLALVVAGSAVWLITVVKFLQLARLRSAERSFERASSGASGGQELHSVATVHRSAPGGRIVLQLANRARQAGETQRIGPERLRAMADRALVHERENASSLLSLLGSIAAAAPFIGLFGTVYGIMDAFIRIGAEKSASLPVVAPAIGEALITTAIGLAAAIPALFFYNAIDKRVGDLIEHVEAGVGEWILLLAGSDEQPVLLTRPSSHPAPAQGAPWGHHR